MAHIDPGPIDPSVLQGQHTHRSQVIWETQAEDVLTCRRADRILHRVIQPRDDRILQCFRQAGFYGVYKIGYVELDHHLITALVERWRVETHSFHLPCGEATVTLQDMGLLSGLPIDGAALTSDDSTCGVEGWGALCEELLGQRPDPTAVKGGRLKLRWLAQTFGELPDHATDVDVAHYARAWILMMIGGSVFPDKSGSYVKLVYLSLLRDFEVAGRLSWGAGALAFLYRELCKASQIDCMDIAGPLVVLQMWAWERCTNLRPTRLGPPQGPAPIEHDDGPVGHVDDGPRGCYWRVSMSRVTTLAHCLRYCRDQISEWKEEQMQWEPYNTDVMASLPDYCKVGSDMWRCRVPLICFDIVEWHLPDRVMRQFGCRQLIPQPCDTVDILHSTDRRGRHGYDWSMVHDQYIQLWKCRAEHVVPGEPFQGLMLPSDPYMRWYRSITRLYIIPPTATPQYGFRPTSGVREIMGHTLATIYHLCMDDESKLARQVKELCSGAFIAIKEHDPVASYLTPQVLSEAEAGTFMPMPHPPPPPPVRKRRRRGVTMHSTPPPPPPPSRSPTPTLTLPLSTPTLTLPLSTPTPTSTPPPPTPTPTPTPPPPTPTPTPTLPPPTPTPTLASPPPTPTPPPLTPTLTPPPTPLPPTSPPPPPTPPPPLSPTPLPPPPPSSPPLPPPPLPPSPPPP